MGTLKIMDGSGDTAVRWDVKEPATVVDASAVFNRLVADQHYNAYGAQAGEVLEEIQVFDETLAKVVLVPQMAGG